MKELTFAALKKFGLTENEVKVYLEALKQEELTPFQISKLTKIPRTTVYDILMGLSLKGLVELEQSDGFKKQQTLVRAKNPSILREILQKKRKELIETEADILHILPEIKKDFHKNKSNADFRFYPGLEGARKVYFESINYELLDPYEDIYAWDMQMPMDAFGIKETNNDVDKQNRSREKRKGKVREIFPLNDWTKHVFTYQTQRNAKYIEETEYRYVENSHFSIYTRLQIAGNFVWIICAKDDEMWGIVLRSKFLALTMRSIFMDSWTHGITVTKKLVESWGRNEFVKALGK